MGTSGATLTIGQDITIRGSGHIRSDNLVNRGTIWADGTTLRVNSDLTSGSIVYSWTNQGMLKASNGGTLHLLWQLPVGGLGQFDSTGGKIIFNGQLDNTGNTLVLDGVGNTLGIAGKVQGGTIITQNGAELVPTSGLFSTLFDGTFVESDLAVGNLLQVTFLNAARLAPGRRVYLQQVLSTVEFDTNFAGEVVVQGDACVVGVPANREPLDRACSFEPTMATDTSGRPTVRLLIPPIILAWCQLNPSTAPWKSPASIASSTTTVRFASPPARSATSPDSSTLGPLLPAGEHAFWAGVGRVQGPLCCQMRSSFSAARSAPPESARSIARAEQSR